MGIKSRVGGEQGVGERVAQIRHDIRKGDKNVGLGPLRKGWNIRASLDTALQPQRVQQL